MKRTIAALLCATAWTGVFGVAPAQAEPISTFLIGVGAGFSAGATVTGAYLGTLGAGFAVGQFLAANIGTLLLAGASLLYQALQNRQMESSQVNFRQPNAVRRHAAGIEEVGGHIGFASYDDAGAFWYMVVHCDSELMEPIAIKFDDVVIAKDGNNRVTTEEFIAEESGWFGWTSRKAFFTHWLATFGVLNPVPPMPSAFTAAFPEWTADHKLAGCTVSIVRIDPVADDKDISGVYRWRGAIGLGEPSVSIIGVWNRVPDPRVPGFSASNRSTWVQSKNPALIAAWHRVRRQGFDMAAEEINWDMVADSADKCDILIEDRYGNEAPLYECGGTWMEDRENKDIEMDILVSCDGMPMFDSEGRWYPKVGFWEEPTLTLTRDRDILAMQDSEATDGESETDGVVVEYKEPDLGYVMQPCAPWRNPNFYVEGREPKYLVVKVPTCKNHRQAVTLAKAIGMRSQPTRKIAPQTGLRGRRAKRERIVAIDYDETITGTWQVVTPVELDAEGATAVLGLVPVGANNWVLLPGEEGEKPVGETVTRDNTIPDPTGIVLNVIVVPGSNSNQARLEAAFDQPARVGDTVEFQYRRSGDTAWQAMDTVMEQLSATSAAVVADGSLYEVQYRMRRGTRSTEWSSPPLTILAATDATAPFALTGQSVDTGGLGQALTHFTTPAGNIKKVAIYANTSGTLNRATDLQRTITVAASTGYDEAIGDPTRSNAALTPDFATDTNWIKGTNWTISGGAAHKAAPTASLLRQLLALGIAGDVWRYQWTMLNRTAGDAQFFIAGGVGANGPTISANGTYRGKLTVTAGPDTQFGIRALSTFAGDVDNVTFFKETATCLPQGTNYVWLIPMNGSNVEGPVSGPYSITVI